MARLQHYINRNGVFRSRRRAGLFPAGLYPSASNVGCASSGLTPQSGNILVTTPGTVIQDLDLAGYIKIQTTDVVIRNCRIRGYSIPSASSAGEATIGLVTTHDASAARVLIDRCTLIPDYPSWDWSGVIGHDFLLRDSLIAHVTDGLDIYNTHNSGGPVNVTADHNFIGYMAWFSPTQSPNSDNATHNDCIQVIGGTNIVVKRNTLWGFRSMPNGMMPGGGNDPFGYVGQGALTVAPAGYDPVASGSYNPTYPAPQSGSGMQWNNSQGTPQTVIDSNYIDGGGASLNVSIAVAAGSQIVNNVFGRNQRLQGAGGDDTYTINGGGSSGANLTVSNNTYADNGHAVRWRQ